LPRRPHRAIPPKLYRVGEIVEYTGCSRQTIHNYTTMGLITEHRRSAGGHRLYDESVFVRLDLIALMKRQRKTMREIRGRLARQGRRT
jgi:DNA-binding transcriptional MerR regulator